MARTSEKAAETEAVKKEQEQKVIKTDLCEMVALCYKEKHEAELKAQMTRQQRIEVVWNTVGAVVGVFLWSGLIIYILYMYLFATI